MGCSSTNEQQNKNSTEYNYCLRPDEIEFIEKKMKEKEENIKNGTEVGGNKLYPLYKKIEIDFTKKDLILKEYIVIYLPKDYGQKIEKYEFEPAVNNIMSEIEKSDSTKFMNLVKLNNQRDLITKFELKQNPEDDYEFQASIEFKINEKEKEVNLITIEANYNIKFKDKYGFINLNFFGTNEKDPIQQKSFSLIIDDNYIKCSSVNKYVFKEITKYKLFAFNQEDFSFKLRDKRIKINIENELDKELLSKLTSDEIKKINNSLNKMGLHYGFRNLIYQKVIHKLQNRKDKIKILDVVFYPHESDGGAYTSPFRNEQPIIINEFKINNVLVKKRKKYKPEYEDENDENYEDDDDGDDNDDDNENDDEDEDEENDEDNNGKKIVSGYYLSKKKMIGFYYYFHGIFGIYEFDCESNEDLDYFALNCISLGDIDQCYTYGVTYKYEIILNGNNLEFCNGKKYEIKNDKIIMEGMIDGNKENFDNDKFEELAKKYERDNLELDDEEYRLSHWLELRLLDFLPEKMQLA